MPRKPGKPSSKRRVAKKAPNPVAKGDIARNRKAGPLPPKKGKGTPYDRSMRKSVKPDAGE